MNLYRLIDLLLYETMPNPLAYMKSFQTQKTREFQICPEIMLNIAAVLDNKFTKEKTKQ